MSRLTITFLRLMAIAPLERQTETIMGSISGVSPTATAMAKKKAPFQSCLVKPLIRKTSGTITAINWIISQVKRLRPRSKLVSTRSPVMELAMLPKYVWTPVVTTTAVAVPLSTLVPMKQMFLSSVGELTSFGLRVVEFLDRKRLAGEASLTDEQIFGREHPHIARNHVAGGELDDVAGHQVAQRHLSALPSRTTVAVTWIMALSFAAAASARASCKKRSPDAQHDHHGHHGAGASVARGKGNCRESRQQNHQRIANDFQEAGWASPAASPARPHSDRPCAPALRPRLASSRPESFANPGAVFAVLPSGIEYRGRNMNILVLRVRGRNRSRKRGKPAAPRDQGLDAPAPLTKTPLSVSGVVISGFQDVFEDGEGTGDVGGSGNERRQEANGVFVRTALEQEQAAMAGVLQDALSELRVGHLVLAILDEFHGQHRSQAAHVADLLEIGMEFLQAVAQLAAMDSARVRRFFLFR